jgi:hypothetical protein
MRRMCNSRRVNAKTFANPTCPADFEIDQNLVVKPILMAREEPREMFVLLSALM